MQCNQSVTDKEYVQEPDLVAALNCGFIFYKELNQPWKIVNLM